MIFSRVELIVKIARDGGYSDPKEDRNKEIFYPRGFGDSFNERILKEELQHQSRELVVSVLELRIACNRYIGLENHKCEPPCSIVPEKLYATCTCMYRKFNPNLFY